MVVVATVVVVVVATVVVVVARVVVVVVGRVEVDELLEVVDVVTPEVDVSDGTPVVGVTSG